MAKRREEEESTSFSWYDQPLYDTGDEEDETFRREDEKPSRSGDRKPQRTGGSHVGLVGGCFIVILNAILSILIFLALGVGIVVAGRAAGILPQTSSAPSPNESSALPLAESSAQPEATQAQVVVEEPTEVGCDMAAWWSAQEGNFDYFVTFYDHVTLATPAEPLETLVSQIQARRDSALAVPTDPCLADVQELFTQGMNGTITAAQSLAAGDRAAAVGPADDADDALSNTLVALWDLGVATAPDTPPALNIPRGGNCDATQLEGWFNPFRQQWGQIYPLITQIDFTVPAVARASLNSIPAFQRNLESMTPPECAVRPQELSTIALNSYTSAADMTLRGNGSVALEVASAYARAYVTLNAWLEWIGAGMV